MNDPVASEAAETAVLLAAKGTGRGIIDAVIIHVGHPGLYPERKPNTALPIPREDAAREAVLGIVGDPQDFCAPTTLMIGAMGPNISSWDTGMSFVTSAKNMRGQDWPSVAPPVITRAPDLRAPAICSKLLLVEYAGRQVILEIEHAGELRLVHQGRAEN